MIKYIKLTVTRLWCPERTSMMRRAKEWVLLGNGFKEKPDYYRYGNNIILLDAVEDTNEQFFSIFPKKYNLTRAYIVIPRRAEVLL